MPFIIAILIIFTSQIGHANDDTSTEPSLLQGKMENMLERSYQATVPVISALKLVVTAESPQEREYALKYVKYRADQLDVVARKVMYILITKAESESESGYIKELIDALDARYPTIGVMSERFKNKIKSNIEDSNPDVLHHSS